MAISQHSDPENTLSCFITCPLYQVLHIQVASVGFRRGTGEELSCCAGSAWPAVTARGSTCWRDEHPPCRDLSAPQVPPGDLFLTLQQCMFRTAGLAWALKLPPELGQKIQTTSNCTRGICFKKPQIFHTLGFIWRAVWKVRHSHQHKQDPKYIWKAKEPLCSRMAMVLHLDLLSKHFHSTPFQSQHATSKCQYHLAPKPIRPWSNKPRETKITQIPTLAASWVDRCYPEGSMAKASSEMPYLDLCTTGSWSCSPKAVVSSQKVLILTIALCFFALKISPCQLSGICQCGTRFTGQILSCKFLHTSLSTAFCS